MRTQVAAVMTRSVAMVRAETPFKEIAEVLIERGVSAVPVVDGEGRVIGVVSEADLLRKEEFRELYYREGYQPPLRTRLRHRLNLEGDPRAKARGDTAAELMTSPAVTVRPRMSTVTAARLMEKHGIKRLPVVDERDHLVGIISRRDLIRVFVRPDADIADDIRMEVLRSRWMNTDQVQVRADQGVVTLTGAMALRSEAELIARMSARVNGVVDVVSEIRWQEDDGGAGWAGA
ncbi:CBS domain-containing protein [Acrocarpospora catenulata]|uniref:CBS domain-containing protein n=1 Tax=Acrocarpospora catenulata TaxID=2836182 RepID=UPI001BD9C65D|nr:CBS domain-containing protein [Acrocarpospora catenulata]